jgi:DNA-binding transcriptional LysR family regulator
LVLAAAPAIADKARPADPSWWLEQTLLSPGVSEVAWPQVWQKLKLRAPEITHPLHFSSYAAALEAACAGHGLLLAPLPFSEREFASGRLSRLSIVRLQSNIGYSLLMRRELANVSRGRALRRRILAAIRPRGQSSP